MCCQTSTCYCQPVGPGVLALPLALTLALALLDRHQDKEASADGGLSASDHVLLVYTHINCTAIILLLR